MADLIAIAETLEAQAAALRREAARLAAVDQAELALEPAEGCWAAWEGGEQPAATYGKVVDYQERNGTQHTGPAAALLWGHDGDGGDIVAFRISAAQPDG